MTNGRLVASISTPRGRRNAHQHVVDRALELAPVHDELAAELQDMRRDFCGVLAIALAALLLHIEVRG